MSYWNTFDDAESNCSVVLEDDDRVAYAYLVDRELGEGDGAASIIGDVWLYNVHSAPPELGPGNRGEPPLNASPYVHDMPTLRLENASEVDVRWFSIDERRHAEVVINGEVSARLCHGSKPGWSRLAAADTPVARRL